MAFEDFKIKKKVPVSCSFFLSQDLLSEIDRKCEIHSVSRSTLIRELIKTGMHELNQFESIDADEPLVDLASLRIDKS